MDRNDETDMDKAEILQRILALLFSLALVAERAAGRSYPVRCYLLWLLRRAAPYAWRCILRECGFEAGVPMPAALRMPLALVILNTPADALRTAATFRALARALEKQLRRDCRLARRQARWEAETLAALICSDEKSRPTARPERRTPRLRLPAFRRSNSAETRWLNAGFP